MEGLAVPGLQGCVALTLCVALRILRLRDLTQVLLRIRITPGSFLQRKPCMRLGGGFPIHLPCSRYSRHRFRPWVWKIPWRRKYQPTPIFLPGKSHGQRSLEDYNPWGHKELDMA